MSIASVCGWRAGTWSGERRGASSESQPKRNARRRAADGSPPHLRSCTIQARDERAVCGVERASSRGGRGDGQPVKRSKPRVGHGGFGDIWHHCINSLDSTDCGLQF